MANLSVTTQQTTVIHQTTTQVITRQPEPQRPAVLPAESNPIPSDTYAGTPQPATPTTPARTIKMLAGGALLGGTAATLATMAAKGAFTDAYHKPTVAGVGLGVALGTGIALINLETGDETINAATKGAGAVLMGGSITGMASSTASALFTDRLQPLSGKSIALGAALGGGIALANMETDNKDLKAVKNTAAGVLIGGSTAGLVTGVAKSLFTDQLHSASTGGALFGAALGGGIALANIETDNKTLNAVKNTAAGALIGTGVAGLGSALIKTLSSNRLSGASPVVMGIAITLGASIGLMTSED